MTTDSEAASTAGKKDCGAPEPCSIDDLLNESIEEEINARAALDRATEEHAAKKASREGVETVKKATDPAKLKYEQRWPDLERQLKELLSTVSRERCDCLVSREEDRTLIRKVWTGTRTYREKLDSCLISLELKKFDAIARRDKATFWVKEAKAKVDAALNRPDTTGAELEALAELKKRVESSGRDSEACRYAFCLDLLERLCELKEEFDTPDEYHCELVALATCLKRRQQRESELKGVVREIESRIELVGSLRAGLAKDWLERLCLAVAAGCSPRFPDSLYPECCGAGIVDDCSAIDPEAPGSDGAETATPPERPAATPDDPCSKPCKDMPKPCEEKPTDPCAEKPTDPCDDDEPEPKPDPCDETGEGGGKGGGEREQTPEQSGGKSVEAS